MLELERLGICSWQVKPEGVTTFHATVFTLVPTVESPLQKILNQVESSMRCSSEVLDRDRVVWAGSNTSITFFSMHRRELFTWVHAEVGTSWIFTSQFTPEALFTFHARFAHWRPHGLHLEPCRDQLGLLFGKARAKVPGLRTRVHVPRQRFCTGPLSGLVFASSTMPLDSGVTARAQSGDYRDSRWRSQCQNTRRRCRAGEQLDAREKEDKNPTKSCTTRGQNVGRILTQRVRHGTTMATMRMVSR